MTRVMRRLLIACIVALHTHTLAAQSQTSRVDYLLKQLADTQSNYVFVAAHRGGREHDWQHRAPENSLANVEKAVRLGFDIYETDVRQSADGVLVIMHDATVDRTTNGTGKVNELTLAQLKRLKLRYKNGNMSAESVPTFEEMVVQGKNRILFKVDYRADLRRLPEAVRILQQHDMLGHVFFRFSWSDSIAKELQNLVRAGMPYHRNLILFRTFEPAQVTAALAVFRPAAVEVESERKVLKAVRKVAHKLDMNGIAQWVDRRDITADAANAVRVARDSKVVLVTRADGGPAEWQRLIDRGFRILHTEQPESMTVWLRKRGLHR
jgi:glycerophosphoryl diester phosphodiesterase